MLGAGLGCVGKETGDSMPVGCGVWKVVCAPGIRRLPPVSAGTGRPRGQIKGVVDLAQPCVHPGGPVAVTSADPAPRHAFDLYADPPVHAPRLRVAALGRALSDSTMFVV